MKNIRNLVLGTTVASAALLAASPASAAIVLCYETGSDVPQCGPTTSNVNIDQPAPGSPSSTVVNGHLNNIPTQLLTFTGDEFLVGDASGQADVSALDGLLNTSVTFALTGATFNLATFNLTPFGGNPGNEATSVVVSYLPTYGGAPITYTLATNGNNMYGIFGDAGEQIQSITWGGYLPAGFGIESIRQVRVAGVQNVVVDPRGVVPEPATWALLLLGFGAVGATLRANKSPSGRRLRVA